MLEVVAKYKLSNFQTFKYKRVSFWRESSLCNDSSQLLWLLSVPLRIHLTINKLRQSSKMLGFRDCLSSPSGVVYVCVFFAEAMFTLIVIWHEVLVVVLWWTWVHDNQTRLMLQPKDKKSTKVWLNMLLWCSFLLQQTLNKHTPVF